MASGSFIKPLGGLRGIAALSVVVAHLAVREFIPLAPFFAAGAVGVMLFFVLSGFLMTHLYLAVEARPAAVLTFVRARFARVYPLYAIIIVASGLATVAGVDLLYPLQPEQALTHLALIGNPSVFWTISIEFQFYALFALFWLAGRGIWRWDDGTVALILVGAYALLWWLGAPGSRLLITHNGEMFIVGMLAALAVRHVRPSPDVTGAALSAAIALPFLAWVAISVLGLDREATYRSVPLHLALGLLVWAAVVGAGSVTGRLLGSRPLLALGDWSYGIYLLHLPVIWPAQYVAERFDIPRPWFALPVMTAVIVLAWLSFKFIEDPIRRAMTGHRRPVAAPVQ